MPRKRATGHLGPEEPDAPRLTTARPSDHTKGAPLSRDERLDPPAVHPTTTAPAPQRTVNATTEAKMRR
ncbi:hypothetical protein [Nocardiopsis sp. ATB16-24]|uniref:hypothetical protein n=1 Tax=Nocardiopsis sp. ATB16-24 TaxID=3019555 RepID=UPI0025578B0E|nr:hypothetical protein [Nocardiopsis sp. ATB16-24]